MLLIVGLLCAGPWLGRSAFVLVAMVLVLPWAVGFGSVYSVHLVLIFLAMNFISHSLPPTASPVLIKTGGIGLYFYVPRCSSGRCGGR